MRKNQKNNLNGTGTRSRSLTGGTNQKFNYEIGNDFANRTPNVGARSFENNPTDYDNRNYLEEYGSDYERRNSTEYDFERNLNNHAASNTNTEFGSDCCGSCNRNRKDK